MTNVIVSGPLGLTTIKSSNVLPKERFRAFIETTSAEPIHIP